MKSRWWMAGLLPLAAALAAMLLHLSLTQQRLQMHADVSAAAAAQAVSEKRHLRAAELLLERGGVARLHSPPQIEAPPRSGRYAGRREAVRVRLHETWRPPLVSRLLAIELEARSTAVIWRPDSGGNESVIVRIE